MTNMENKKLGMKWQTHFCSVNIPSAWYQFLLHGR